MCSSDLAKEILVEVFHARPSEVEEMIKRRLEEKSWDEETDVWPASDVLRG